MATVTLRPIASGTYSHANVFAAGAVNKWDCVDDVISDDDATTITFANSGGDTDLYETYQISTNSIGASDTINSITVYARHRQDTGKGQPNIAICIYENSTLTTGSAIGMTSSYVISSKTWTVKPSNSTAFTKADIDILEIGVDLIRTGSPANGFCTQIYVIVDYTPSGGGGSSPAVKPIMMMLETDD